MSRLVLVGDAAYPSSIDFSTLPADLYAFCGYFGGDTPHIITDSEIAAIRGHGLAFWPIWTAPNSKTGTAINATNGAYDASQMLIQLKKRHITPDTPSFYDIEYSTYHADSDGAAAAITAYQSTMHAGGYPIVYPYVPKDFNKGWIAYWTNVRPSSLPSGWVGQQYSGIGGVVDLSIFDLDLLGVDDVISDNDVERIANSTRDKVSATLQAYIPAELGGSIQRLVTLLGLTQQEATDIAAIKTRLSTMGTVGSSLTPEQEHAFAVEISKVFGAALNSAA